MLCRRETFLKLTADDVIDNSEGNELHLLETDRDPVPTCIGFVRSVIALFLALYHVY